jgi:hypothetical protein
MATSGSYDVAYNRNEVITEALELNGQLSPDETLPSHIVTSCTRTLNMMLKFWQSDGIALWRNQEVDLTLVASQAEYTLGPTGSATTDPSTIQRPLFISSARLHKDSDVEIPVEVISGDEYRRISLKTVTGPPSMVTYAATTGNGTLKIWPTASSVTEYLILNCRMPVADMDSSSDDFDFPQEWLLPIAYNLAVLIAPKFGNNISSEVKYQAQLYYEWVVDSSKDFASVIFE